MKKKTVKAWAVISPEEDVEFDLIFYSSGDVNEMPFAVFSPYDKEEAETWAKICGKGHKVISCSITYEI